MIRSVIDGLRDLRGAAARLPGGTVWRSGARLAVGLAGLGLLALSACNYSFTAGAGFPDYVETMAILPFDNETNRFELTDEIHRQMLAELPRALGVQSAGEAAADVVVRGVITGYDVSTPNYRSTGSGNAEVLQREVRVRAQVQIVDLEQRLILWENRSLSGNGQYLEASETEDVGRTEAIELLVQSVVDGAQSNW